MSRLPKPYMKCEIVRGAYLLTLMGSGSRGHVLVGRETVPLNDPKAMTDTVIAMVTKARRPEQSLGRQANGDS